MPSPREKNVAGRGVEQPGRADFRGRKDFVGQHVRGGLSAASRWMQMMQMMQRPTAPSRRRCHPSLGLGGAVLQLRTERVPLAREAPSAFAEKGPAAPLADTQAAEIRQDLASIQLQLQRLLAGQSEIQVLRPWHVNGEETFPKAKDLHPGKRQTGSSMMSPGSVNSIQENSDEIKKVALQRLFDLAEDHEEKMRKMKRQRSHQKVSEMMSPQHLEMTVDTIMAVPRRF
ncbi:unnamed protein product [Effrenium voratum]|nr:unnamed protein product [Effrenium voratum]